jgi:hypothetical protein
LNKVARSELFRNKLRRRVLRSEKRPKAAESADLSIQNPDFARTTLTHTQVEIKRSADPPTGRGADRLVNRANFARRKAAAKLAETRDRIVNEGRWIPQISTAK